MKTPSRYLNSTRGSALFTVIMVMLIMALLTASMLSYSGSERRANEFNRLVLRTRNMAENTVNFATAQIASKMRHLRSTSPIQYVVGSTGPNELFLPDVNTILATENGAGVIDAHAGLFSSSPLTYIDPTDPANATDPNAGLSAIVSKATVVGSAKLTHKLLLPYTAYVQQDLSIAQIPLFQYAIFYNGNLEIGSGSDMIIEGPVHANGSIAVRNQYGLTNTVQFKDRVSATGGFYANIPKFGTMYVQDGTADNNPGGNGPLRFQNPAGTVTDIRSGSIYNDHTMSNNAAGPETTAPSGGTVKQFGDWATPTYGVNLRTSAHGVEEVTLPGVQELADNSRQNAARSTIEPPMASDTAGIVENKFSRHAGLYIIVNPTGPNPDITTGPTAGCRQGIKPDGTTVWMQPYTYRCWLNSVAADGISHVLMEVVLPGQPSYGDPTLPATNPNTLIRNNLPNRFTDNTAIGSNQVLRIPSTNVATYSVSAGPPTYPGYPLATATTPVDAPYRTYANGGGKLNNFYTDPATPPATGYYIDPTATLANTSMNGFRDAYFYDLRRASRSNGYPANRSAAAPFDPRPIAKIDFDMIRFRLAVERTMYNSTMSTPIFNPDVPSAANWNNNVLNSAAVATTYSLYPNKVKSTDVPNTRTYTAPFPVDAAGNISCDPFHIYKATAPGAAPVPVAALDLLNTTQTATPWYDGIAIYIHSVDAENRDFIDATIAQPKRKRMDSGVRLWNGRGPVVSLTPAGRTGCSIATNDALYIVGHYNASGSINATTTSTGTGGYSARYPEADNERLCNVMADAITILSQPVYDNNYRQTSGWSDSLSANARETSSGNWFSTNPSTSNQFDGTANSISAGAMPNQASSAAMGATAPFATARTKKFYASDTEISSCLVVGIVRTTAPLDASNPLRKPRGNELVDGAPTGAPLLYELSGSQYSGGAHNFPRMLEDWTTPGSDLYIRGSMVAMFESEVAVEPWLATRIYSAPGRRWGLHENLRAQNASNGLHDVPLEPVLIKVSRWHYTALSATDYAAKVAAITALPTN